MNAILSEKEYQSEILSILRDQNGYTIRNAKDFDRRFALDREMMFAFLNDTQPETMDKLRKIHKDKLEDTLVSFINGECAKKRGSLLDVLRHGVEISGTRLDLMYTKPATTFNKDLMRKYEMNCFTVMEEVWASDKERVDVVIFINGFAIITMELKCNFAGQSAEDAVYQYRMDRDPKSRLFLFKAGALVNFAMDLNTVFMTTKLEGEKTFFLPFNKGNGEGVNAGAGNPPCEDDYPVHYMWDDILTKDTVACSYCFEKLRHTLSKSEFDGKRLTLTTQIAQGQHEKMKSRHQIELSPVNIMLMKKIKFSRNNR